MMKKINILIIGFFPQTTKNRIREIFPQEWSVRFASPEDYKEALCDTDIVIPEHVKINGAFLDQVPVFLDSGITRILVRSESHADIDLAFAVRGRRL